MKFTTLLKMIGLGFMNAIVFFFGKPETQEFVLAYNEKVIARA